MRDVDEWEGYCQTPMVDKVAHERVSALLGPDGNPLMVPYARPRIGFDLTPRRPEQTREMM